MWLRRKRSSCERISRPYASADAFKTIELLCEFSGPIIALEENAVDEIAAVAVHRASLLIGAASSHEAFLMRSIYLAVRFAFPVWCAVFRAEIYLNHHYAFGRVVLHAGGNIVRFIMLCCMTCCILIVYDTTCNRMVLSRTTFSVHSRIPRSCSTRFSRSGRIATMPFVPLW